MVKVPGSVLGTEEEYVAGSNTYVEEGRIYSAAVGKENDAGREKAVSPFVKKPRGIMKGMIVYGIVREIFEPIALIELSAATIEGERQAFGSDYAVLHVSKIMKGYVESVKAELKIGDIVKARVEDIRDEEIYLTTADKDLGVIKAFCANCRQPMKLEGEDLVCEGCGRKDRRKVGYPYRSFKVV